MLLLLSNIENRVLSNIISVFFLSFLEWQNMAASFFTSSIDIIYCLEQQHSRFTILSNIINQPLILSNLIYPFTILGNTPRSDKGE